MKEIQCYKELVFWGYSKDKLFETLQKKSFSMSKKRLTWKKKRAIRSLSLRERHFDK